MRLFEPVRPNERRSSERAKQATVIMQFLLSIPDTSLCRRTDGKHIIDVLISTLIYDIKHVYPCS